MAFDELEDGPVSPLVARIVSALNPLKITAWENPVFEQQLIRLRWPHSSGIINRQRVVEAKLSDLKYYTATFGCLVPMILAVIGGIVIAAVPLTYYLLPFAALAALGFSLLSNIYYAIAAINTILPQMSTAQWEPLRLTMLTEEEILLANHATVQIRVWRVALVDVAIRLILSLSPVIGIMLLIIGYQQSVNWFMYLSGLVLALIVIVGLILEPLWRMRTVTLIAMTVAVWAKSYGVALLVTFSAILALLILQVALISGLLIFIIQAGSHLYDAYIAQDFAVLLFAFSSVGLTVVSVYFFFKGAQFVAFATLKWTAFRSS